MSGQPAEAEAPLRFALKSHPNLPRSNYLLAKILDDSDRRGEALEFYLRAATLQPDNNLMILERAAALAEELGQSAQAEALRQQLLANRLAPPP